MDLTYSLVIQKRVKPKSNGWNLSPEGMARLWYEMEIRERQRQEARRAAIQAEAARILNREAIPLPNDNPLVWEPLLHNPHIAY
jgi:hypothetical protein